MKEIKKTEILTVRLTEEMKRHLEFMSKWEDRSSPSFLELIIRALSENYVLLKRIQLDEQQKTGYPITFTQIISRALQDFAVNSETNKDIVEKAGKHKSSAKRNKSKE